MGARRTARECALMILYELDLSGATAEGALERFFATFGTGDRLDPLPPYAQEREGPELEVMDDEVRSYTARLVRGVADGKEKLDQLIQKVSTHWRIDRMACVDRNLLRLSTYELTELQAEVPRKVAINEAVEIAKRFGTAESSAFINGILDRVGK